MDYKQYKADFDRDGFIVVRQFLPEAGFRALTTQIDRYIREVVPTLTDSDAFYQSPLQPENPLQQESPLQPGSPLKPGSLKQLQHMAIDPFFDSYRNNPHWAQLAEALVGEPVAGLEPEWFNKPPSVQHPTPPHQDNFYFCLRPCNVVTLWLALDPVGEQNGCLRYLPGSHRQGIRPHQPTSILGFSQGVADYGPEDLERERAVFLEPGDLVAHHGETVHRAEPNRTTDRHRRAFAIVFRGMSCRRDEPAFDRYESAMREQHRQMGLLNMGE